MNIVKYDIIPHEETYVIWAQYGTTKRQWFSLPPTFANCSIGKIEAEQLVFNLTRWYGLPVDAEIVMSHFTKEILK